MGKKMQFVLKSLKLGTEPLHIVMLGLDGSGKTTILYRMKLDQNIYETRPTTAFNVETISVLKNKFRIWDVSGTESHRSLWKAYIRKSHGIIFVIDSTDTDRFEEAKVELENVLNCDVTKKLPILILANKQDKKTSISAISLSRKLNLDSLDKSVKWRLCDSSGCYGNGLNEAMIELAQMIEEYGILDADSKHINTSKIGCFENTEVSKFI